MSTQGRLKSASPAAERFGELLVKVSALLFAVAIPTSVALDNGAAALGLLGFLLLAFSGALSPLPPLRPLGFLLAAEVWHYLLNPGRIFKATDLKLYLLSYFVGFRCALERDFLKKVGYLLGFSTALMVLSQLFEAVTWQNVKHVDFSHLQLHTALIRAKGLLNHPLTTGGVLFTLFFLHLALYRLFKNRLFSIFSALALLGVVLSQSRSYWVGTFVFFAVLFLVSLLKAKYRRFAVVSLVLFGLFAISLFSIPQLRHRFESIGNTTTNGSNTDRLAIWTAYLTAFKRDYTLPDLLLGTGDRAEEIALKEGYEACLKFYPRKVCEGNGYVRRLHNGLSHNIYLKFLSKYGLLGLLAYLYFWGYALFENFRAFWQREKIIYLVFAAGYLGFLAAGFFENNFTDAEVQTAVLFSLGINYALLMRRSD
ncbi:O-antigen ligase family protein [Thermovibrio ammonificans]